MRNCEKIDKLTVDKIMTREHDCYILEEVDCLSVDRVTFKLITSPKFLRLIIKAINENCNIQSCPPKINGKSIRYESEDENNPVSYVKSKSTYDPAQGATYKLIVKITFRVSALLKKQEDTQMKQTMITKPNTPYNISKLLLNELERVFTVKGNDITFDELFSFCCIDSVNMKGCIDLKYLPNLNSENYMRLLSCARRYRYTNDYEYDYDKKELYITGRSFTLLFKDGNNKLDTINENISDDFDKHVDLYKFNKDKIYVMFRTTDKFINNNLKIISDGDDDKELISINTLVKTLRYIHESFTKFMIFMYSECDFYDAESALQIINNSRYHLDTKRNLCNYVKCCAKDTECTENGKMFKEFFGAKYSNAYSNNLKKFVNMGLSPIIIPDMINVKKYKNPLVYMYLTKRDMFDDK